MVSVSSTFPYVLQRTDSPCYQAHCWY